MARMGCRHGMGPTEDGIRAPFTAEVRAPRDGGREALLVTEQGLRRIGSDRTRSSSSCARLEHLCVKLGVSACPPGCVAARPYGAGSGIYDPKWRIVSWNQPTFAPRELELTETPSAFMALALGPEDMDESLQQPRRGEQNLPPTSRSRTD